MIANFSKLHDEVHESSSVLIVPNRSFFDEIHDADFVSQIGVVCTLSIRQFTKDVLLNLITKFLLDMFLNAPKHEGFKNHVKAPKLIDHLLASGRVTWYSVRRPNEAFW